MTHLRGQRAGLTGVRRQRVDLLDAKDAQPAARFERFDQPRKARCAAAEMNGRISPTSVPQPAAHGALNMLGEGTDRRRQRLAPLSGFTLNQLGVLRLLIIEKMALSKRGGHEVTPTRKRSHRVERAVFDGDDVDPLSAQVED